jgi:hypothetical protein
MKFLYNKLQTLRDMLKFFMAPKRAVLIPLLVVLLLTAILLIFANGLSVVAPFVYTLF